MQLKNIEIKLEINGEEKTFTNTKVKGRLLLTTTEVIEVFQSLEKGLDKDKIKALADYMVDVFGGKFTRDEYLDGIDIEDAVPVIRDIAETIMDMASSKIKN